METSQAVVAIDGPSGSGKSSTSRGVGAALGLEYLDTGAMYRAMAWYMLERGVDVDDPPAVAAHVDEPELRVTTDPAAPGIWVGEADVAEAIRGQAVTAAVSPVAAVPEVRRRLVELQRAVVAGARERGHGIVVEGRDIGTVVLPDATAKIFLTADSQARAARRALEDAVRAGAGAGAGAEAGTNEGAAAGAGQSGAGAGPADDANLAAAAASLAARDAIDSGRAVSPLRRADGAVQVDGTFLTLEQVIETVVGIVREACAA